MTKIFIRKHFIISLAVSLLLISTFFAGKAVMSYASNASFGTQMATTFGPCWRCVPSA